MALLNDADDAIKHAQEAAAVAKKEEEIKQKAKEEAEKEMKGKAENPFKLG
jgi:hypothetical protein